MPDPQKRKKPPAFHHYPPDRARKLKKEWVERAKIKSRWKAQKRREGIVSLRSGKIPQEGEDQRQEHADDDEYGHDKGSEGSVHSDLDSAGAEQPGTAFGGPPDSDSNNLSPPPRSPGARQKKLGKQQQQYQRRHRDNVTTRDDATTSSNTDDKKTSVRDLFQKAYSKSSLHTYKSDSFKRGRNSHHNRGGRGSSNKTRGTGAPSRGRGQPNMKLRMNAMLAKITEQTKTQ